MTREVIMRRRRLSGARGAGALIAALVAVLVAAGPAWADGQLTLTIDGASGAGCGLLIPFGSEGLLSASPCGQGPLTLRFGASGLGPPVPLGPGVLQRPSSHAAAFSIDTATASADAARALGVVSGTRVGYQVDAPAGFAFTGVQASQGATSGVNTGAGWGGAFYADGDVEQWQSYAQRVATDRSSSSPNGYQLARPSSYFGVVLVCGWAWCRHSAQMSLNGVSLMASESQTPTITPVGANNLWDQTVPGRWIWNDGSALWSMTVSGADPSGVCQLSAFVNKTWLSGPSATPVTSQWHQCPDPTWPLAIDTRDYVSGAGQLPISLSAQNAAEADSQLPPGTSMAETVAVDNQPVTVGLSTPDDPNPTIWVNHAVRADVTASAGPSGLATTACTMDGGGAAQSLPGAGGQTMNGQVTLNGDGVHVLSCSASNNAVNPNGQHNSGASSITVHIDQAAPTLSIESDAEHPNDPTSVVADTSDTESGVASGSIEMAPAGSSNWTSLPTALTDGQLLAQFDDSRLTRGRWDFRATSCDRVGNCASTMQTLALPVRLAATSDVGLGTAPQCPSSTPVSAGGSPAPQPSSGGAGLPGDHPRARRARRARQARAAARISILREAGAARVANLRGGGCPLTSRMTGAFGRPVVVHGVLMSSAGLPLSDQTVNVLTAPDNGSHGFAQAAAVSTGPDGSWTTTLPAGPSRIIRASFAGSARILPATGQATVRVPARISLTVTPRRVPWSRTVTVRGHLDGGYVPPDGVALRLLIRLPHRSRPYEPIPLRTDAAGNFVVRWTWGTGYGVVSEPFAIATNASESDYPFTASRSRWIPVTFGLPTPRHRRRHHHHRRHHRRSATATSRLTAVSGRPAKRRDTKLHDATGRHRRRHHHHHHHHHHRHHRHQR